MDAPAKKKNDGKSARKREPRNCVSRGFIEALAEAPAHIRDEIQLTRRVQPPSAVRVCLTVIDRFPDTVEKALLGAA
jgi:hypothetical protein